MKLRFGDRNKQKVETLWLIFFNKYFEVSLNIRKTLEVNEVLMNYSRMHKLGL